MDEKQLAKMLEETFSKTEEKILSAIDAKIKEGIDAKVSELGLKKVEEPFKGAMRDEKGNVTLEAKAKIVDFFRKVLSGDVAELKAMNEGTGSAGGYLVPEEFRIEVQRIAEETGLVRAFAAKFPMKRDTLNVPAVSTSVSVYFPGEATAGTESQPVLANVALNAKTCVGLTLLSDELLEDADTDTVGMLAELFAEALSEAEDDQGLTGTGSPFTGILGNSSVTAVTFASGTTFSDVTLNDLRDAISNVKASVLPSAAFIMHRSVWGIIQKLTENSQHVSTYQNPIVPMGGAPAEGTGPKVHGYIWGYPVYLSEQMPSVTGAATKFIIFGSLKKGLFFGDRKQVTVKVSDSAVVGGVSSFETGQQAVKVSERFALAVGLPGAFCTLKTHA